MFVSEKFWAEFLHSNVFYWGSKKCIYNFLGAAEPSSNILMTHYHAIIWIVLVCEKKKMCLLHLCIGIQLAVRISNSALVSTSPTF